MFEVTERQIAAKQHQHEAHKPVLYVRNLHQKVTKEDLIDLFSAIGELQETSLHHDSSGRSLGIRE